MKKQFLIFLAILFLSFEAYSKNINQHNDQSANRNQIVINNDMNELIELGYVLQTQETRGIVTVYVLKKGNEYVSCRIERSIKKQIEKCYEIELINK